MLEKARRYLRSAGALNSSGDRESAVSRLYYAMFYCARALLEGKVKATVTHKGVLSAFAQHYIKTGVFPAELHRWLNDAFRKRQVSDYSFVEKPSEQDVSDLTGKAAEFLRRTEEYLKTSGLL